MRMSQPALDNCASKNGCLTLNTDSCEATGGCQGRESENTGSLDQRQGMGHLATKIVTEEKSNENVSYYGIYIPVDSRIDENNGDVHVYLDKAEAMKVFRKHKKARLKVFTSKQAAVKFAAHGSELDNVMSPQSEQPDRVDSGSQLIGEKPSLFKGPKSQDLVQLRKAIELGDLQAVKSLVWSNPRYLVSSGDTPAILQEGSRYNALHVAAKARNAAMSELIVQTVGDPSFVGLLYGDEDRENCVERASILLDLYLNTPDKGLNETPLHFAAKFGAGAVVETLVSCRQCCRNPRNKFGQTPKDIVCSRVSSPDPGLKKEIMDLLEENFYVPVWRSEDNSVQPTIGTPFSPSAPPDVNHDLLGPRLEMHALAGPLSSEDAIIFRKKWKTPPRILHSPAGSPAVASTVSLQDTEKGLERIGRCLAKEFRTGWMEYWPFLGCYANLSSPEGLELLELHLKKQYLQANDCSVGSPDLSENVMTQDSIDSSNSSSISPVTDLCLALKACSISDSSARHYNLNNVVRRKIKNSAAGDGYNIEEDTFLNSLANPGLSPLQYVEKSCQVFAKRIADFIVNMMANLQDFQTVELVLDMFLAEMRHLQSLVNSYMEDSRFTSVDFCFLHSRISSIVAYKLHQLENIDTEIILCGLNNVLQCQKVVDQCSSDEDDNSNTTMYRVGHKKKDMSVQNHVWCVTQQIVNAVMKLQENNSTKSDGRVDSEAECKGVWGEAVECSCRWQRQSFTRTRKGASFKRNRGFKIDGMIEQNNTHDTRTLLNSVSKRLSFSETHGVHTDGDAPENGSRTSYHEVPVTDDDDDDDDDSGSFRTATSSPQLEDSDDELHSADEGIKIYIEGETPNKMDLYVLQAIEGCDINSEKYPNIYWWQRLMLEHSEEERRRWDTPSTARHLRNRRELSSSSFLFSPVASRERIPATTPCAWQRIAGRYAPTKLDSQWD